MGIIGDDFEEFVDNSELFSYDVKIYTSQGGTLIYDGKVIYDKKPQLVENENNEVFYQGHKSLLSISMNKLTIDDVSVLKDYYVEITDGTETLTYTIANASFSSNVNKALCELKET